MSEKFSIRIFLENRIKDNIRRLKYLAKRVQKMLLEPVMGYTRMVFATKYILSFIATILILVLIVLPLVNPVHDNFRITFTTIEGGAEAEQAKMINPRFQGVDNDDQTYSISADNAINDKNEAFILNNINADINLKDESWIALIANSGFFDLKNEALSLDKSVNLFTNDGYEFYTKSLHIDISDSSAYSDSKVHGSGPIGSLTADKVRIYDKGDRIVFKGNVTLLLRMEKSTFFATEDE